MTDGLKLYDIGAQLQALENAFIDAGGEATPEQEAAFASLGELEADKIDGYRFVVQRFEHFARDCAAEASILREKQTAAENAAKRLKTRLQAYMEAKGVKELPGRIFKAAIQRNSSASFTLLVEPTALPRAYQRIITSVSADTELLRALADADGVVKVDEVMVAKVQLGSHLKFR